MEFNFPKSSMHHHMTIAAILILNLSQFLQQLSHLLSMTPSFAQSNDKHNHPNSGQEMNSSNESDERTEPWVSMVSSSLIMVMSLRP
jgi:hypothetical protein